jgi:hypothetical protein
MLPFLAMAVASPIGGWFSDILTRTFGKRVGRSAIGATGLALAAVFGPMELRLRMPALPALSWPAAPGRCIFRSRRSGP